MNGSLNGSQNRDSGFPEASLTSLGGSRLTEERSKAEINSGLRRSDENQVLSH